MFLISMEEVFFVYMSLPRVELDQQSVSFFLLIVEEDKMFFKNQISILIINSRVRTMLFSFLVGKKQYELLFIYKLH